MPDGSAFSGKPRIVSWFSCGDASAVTTKLVLARYGATHEIAIARCVVPEEHPDNERFARDCEAWFGQPVINLRSEEYASCEEVWTKRRYLSGINGAPCTGAMKKEPRFAFQREWNPAYQAWGFTVEERERAKSFRANNPDAEIMLTPLIDEGLSKDDCHALVARAGIELPAMYRLGFPNANCMGCVKAQSPAYWNLTRRVLPEVFERRARLSRELGVRLVKLTSGDRDRVFLDELTPEMGEGKVLPETDCSLLCYISAQKMESTT